MNVQSNNQYVNKKGIDYIMTNLELMICEAENNGEIDLDTRDVMLSILNESTAEAREAERIYKEIKNKEELIRKFEEIIKKSRKEDDFNKRHKIKKAAQEKIDKLTKEIGQLQQKVSKYSDAYLRKMHGDNAARMLKSDLYGSSKDDREYWAGSEISKGMKVKKRKNNTKERTPGRYKTCSGLKESVLEEIYEAELCGDITPEERMALIDYMED